MEMKKFTKFKIAALILSAIYLATLFDFRLVYGAEKVEKNYTEIIPFSSVTFNGAANSHNPIISNSFTVGAQRNITLHFSHQRLHNMDAAFSLQIQRLNNGIWTTVASQNFTARSTTAPGSMVRALQQTGTYRIRIETPDTLGLRITNSSIALN